MAAEQPTGEQQSGFLAKLLSSGKDSGPGWLLSAYTLGSGSAIGSLWAGAQYGYQLLWIQPLAMLMGVVALSGAAYVFVNNKERPYKLLYRANPAIAVAWALGSLFASVIWHFPQYGLAYRAVLQLTGLENTMGNQVLCGGVMLAAMIALTWSYARGATGVRLYELLIKVIVWTLTICLATVVLMVDVDWGAALHGLLVPTLPNDNMNLFYGMLSAAVGINMTFLYPYSVQEKAWTSDEDHDGFKVAVKDLFLGMMLPYVIATGLMILATAATLHASGTELSKGNIEAMGQVFNKFGSIGPKLFFLGLLAMPLSSISLHMLTCGFILSEMVGVEKYGKIWKIGTLIPAVGVLGVAYKLAGWLPVSASALTLIFLPIAYLGFTMLFKREIELPEAAEGQIAVPMAKRPRALLPTMIVVLVVITALAAQKGYQSFFVDLPGILHPAG